MCIEFGPRSTYVIHDSVFTPFIKYQTQVSELVTINRVFTRCLVETEPWILDVTIRSRNCDAPSFTRYLQRSLYLRMWGCHDITSQIIEPMPPVFFHLILSCCVNSNNLARKNVQSKIVALPRQRLSKCHSPMLIYAASSRRRASFISRRRIPTDAGGAGCTGTRAPPTRPRS